MVQHVDIVRFCDIGQTVRNQDDRLAPGQPVDARHNVILALDINIRRGFVKDIDGAIMQQGAGQCQTLPLPAGQVAAALGQRGVQAVLPAQEVRKIHLLQCAPQRAIIGVRRGHA